MNWDASWSVATSADEGGWYAEFRIPFSTLRYGEGEEQTWGLNVVRRVRRLNEQSFWSPIPREFDEYRLSYAGTLIDGFTLTFADGRVTDVRAKRGEETLRRLVETDEGASRLGEVALVPHSSPISSSGILFYNTLYDENASSHLAVGKAYPKCLRGGAEMSPEERGAAGINHSLVHVDFMIGSAELDIDGLDADGAADLLIGAPASDAGG